MMSKGIYLQCMFLCHGSGDFLDEIKIEKVGDIPRDCRKKRECDIITTSAASM